ncbi:YqiA/YcfP family alpha/beta fold hydrolase [Chitinibacter tainanensis]|uniref:YqiA/YcfP family alpha/beta fold hydrolase n=1 Tax=Chitinibacter tainanensis TaxID=230667 RepID=UPI002353FAE9|nr:YqiA/YcfP family alpha/beta fold hydrolase [Chitinibacter tainanensis]
MTTLIYLHGFLSSPLSEKAQQTQAWMQAQGLAEQYLCPQLPMNPQQAIAQLRELLAPLAGDFCLIGSSLGGFFATWAIEEYGGRAVLINPAVQPYTLIEQYLGPQQNYQTGEIHIIDASFALELRHYERRPSQAQRYWLLSQTGDEVLDYRHAVDYYQGCRQTILPGGDHGFIGYADWLPAIWAFANGTAAAQGNTEE